MNVIDLELNQFNANNDNNQENDNNCNNQCIFAREQIQKDPYLIVIDCTMYIKIASISR